MNCQNIELKDFCFVLKGVEVTKVIAKGIIFLPQIQ